MRGGAICRPGLDSTGVRRILHWVQSVLQRAIYWSKSGENLVVIHVTGQNILNEIAKNRVVIQKNRVVIQKNRVIK